MQTSFYDPISIYEREIIYKFLEVFSKSKALTIDDILYGYRNTWTEKFMCSIPLTNDDIANHKNRVKYLKNVKNHNHRTLEKFFQEYIQDHDVKIDKKKYYQITRDKIIDEFVISCLQDKLLKDKLKKHLHTRLPNYLEIDPVEEFLENI